MNAPCEQQFDGPSVAWVIFSCNIRPQNPYRIILAPSWSRYRTIAVLPHHDATYVYMTELPPGKFADNACIILERQGRRRCDFDKMQVVRRRRKWCHVRTMRQQHLEVPRYPEYEAASRVAPSAPRPRTPSSAFRSSENSTATLNKDAWSVRSATFELRFSQEKNLSTKRGISKLFLPAMRVRCEP